MKEDRCDTPGCKEKALWYTNEGLGFCERCHEGRNRRFSIILKAPHPSYLHQNCSLCRHFGVYENEDGIRLCIQHYKSLYNRPFILNQRLKAASIRDSDE